MSYEAWGEPEDGPEGYVTEEAAEERFVDGLVAMRETLARFVEQGGDAVTANSLRLNWNPAWGTDPLRGPAETPPVAGRGEWEVGDRARVIADNEYGDGAADIGIEFVVEGLREGSQGRTVLITAKATRGFDGFYAERCERPPAEITLSGAQGTELSTQLRDRKTPSPEEE